MVTLTGVSTLEAPVGVNHDLMPEANGKYLFHLFSCLGRAGGEYKNKSSQWVFFFVCKHGFVDEIRCLFRSVFPLSLGWTVQSHPNLTEGFYPWDLSREG